MKTVKDKTLGYKETNEYLTQLRAEMKLDGFVNQSDYLRHLIECQRHFRNFGARDFYQRFKGTTTKVYTYSGERISITFNSEKDVNEYLMRVQEGYRFFYDRLLFRPDLARELLAIDPKEMEKFFNEQKVAKADQNQEKKPETEV